MNAHLFKVQVRARRVLLHHGQRRLLVAIVARPHHVQVGLGGSLVPAVDGASTGRRRVGLRGILLTPPQKLELVWMRTPFTRLKGCGRGS